MVAPASSAIDVDDPDERHAYVYRPGRAVDVMEQATELRGDPELPGLILDLRSIW